jgi:hypothetical protein
VCPAVKELTSVWFGSCSSGDILANEFEELILGDLQIFGELLGCQTGGHGVSEGVALTFKNLKGAAVVLFEGAGPGLIGLLYSFLESSTFEDEGGELDGLVGGGREAALGRGDEPGCGVQADGVAEEVRDAPGLIFGDL